MVHSHDLVHVCVLLFSIVGTGFFCPDVSTRSTKKKSLDQRSQRSGPGHGVLRQITAVFNFLCGLQTDTALQHVYDLVNELANRLVFFLHRSTSTYMHGP